MQAGGSQVAEVISQVGDVDTLRALLPHQLLVDLLAERLQVTMATVIARSVVCVVLSHGLM